MWRKQMTLQVLRQGQATRGQIDTVEENYNVRVNRRHPWAIGYHFQVAGRNYAGKETTLNRPGPHLQPGRAVSVLYLPDTPEHHALYPHP